MTGLLAGVGSPTEPAPAPPARRRRLPRLRYLIVGMVFAGALAFLLTKMGGSLNYFDTVDQAVAQKATLGTETLRLEGLVVPGTVHRTARGVDFVAAGSKHEVDVVDTGNPPQLFQPDIPVVVVGHFSGWTFVSNQIIVDHNSTYIEKSPNGVSASKSTLR